VIATEAPGFRSVRLPSGYIPCWHGLHGAARVRRRRGSAYLHRVHATLAVKITAHMSHQSDVQKMFRRS
jgi:hypothetical protein